MVRAFIEYLPWLLMEVLNSSLSGFGCHGDILGYRPILSMMSLLMILILFITTSKTVHRYSEDDPENNSSWIFRFMSILYLLKHLNSLSDFSGGFIVSLLMFRSSQAVFVITKPFGLPVSASRYKDLLFILFLAKIRSCLIY